MSRSRKKPIIKDHPKNFKKWYWRVIRRKHKEIVRGFDENIHDTNKIPNPKEIIKDDHYCDFVIDYRDNFAGKKYTDKISRK